MIPGWSPIKVVQTVPVGCISRSRGQKIGFQNAIFKNLLVRNYKAQSFHIWYTTLTADFADSAIDRGHSRRGRLSFGKSPSLPRIHVRDDRVE